MKEIVSPIAIDMGAKYTGVYLTQYEPGQSVEDVKPKGLVVMHTENIQLSQAERMANRHQTRTGKRRKLAKRLMWLILNKHYKMPFESFEGKEQEALNSLLNRRGFTFLSEGVDEAFLAELPTEPYSLYFHDSIPPQGTLLDFYLEATKDLETVRGLVADQKYQITPDVFAKKLEGKYKEDKKRLKAGLVALKKGLALFVKAEQDGSKMRKAYLSNIKADILEHADYQFLRERFKDYGIEKFINLIGHISNLQLRVLRRYFNDKQMRKRDIWKPEKLHQMFYRNVCGMHYKPDTEEKQRQQALVKLKSKDILDIFESNDPALSIPPFEDQNNRRPPRCQTLRITGDTLNERLPTWRRFLPKLADAIERSGTPVKKGLELSATSDDAWAQCLQRILELSYAHDPYSLRSWIDGTKHVGEFTSRAIAEFDRNLQHQHRAGFIAFAKQFLAETDLARKSLWFEECGEVLSTCGCKPPHKRNQLTELLSAAVNAELTDEQVEQFKDLYWPQNEKVGRRGIRGWCELAADMQKEYGNALKAQMNRNIWLDTAPGRSAENKKLVDLYRASSKVAEVIAGYFGIDSKRFANAFDLAKIYNLMKNDAQGFSKTCRRCTRENTWRSTMATNHKGKESALALRLPADTTRPFDGLLARLMDKQAYEIAKAKVEQLKKLEKGGAEHKVSLPILVEENRFRFAASLAEVKSMSKDAKSNLKKALATENGWADKDSRIKAASRGVCPYEGVDLDFGGEIDHIVSRSESKGKKQTVFNHEANLIYCSSRGNTNKGFRTYHLGNLHDRYLEVQFGTKNRAVIKERLIAACKPIIAKGTLVNFAEISDESTKQAIRHGLFVDELRYELVKLLHQSIKTRVNGTQAYFAKLIMQKIKQLYPHDIAFDVHFVESKLINRLRQQLGEQKPEYAKAGIQPVASHVIDAAMVIAAGLEQPYTQESLQSCVSGKENWLEQLLPNSISIERLESKEKYNKSDLSSKKLFNDSIYAEHFVPFIVTRDKVGVGFSSQNVAWFGDQAEAPQLWVRTLKPYLEQPVEDLQALKSMTRNGFKALTVKKPAAFELLHKVAKQSCSDEELMAADMLEALHYVTRKTDVRSVLYNDDKKSYAKQSDIYSESMFEIKVEASSKRLPAKLKQFDGKTVRYPGGNEWNKLSLHRQVRLLLGSKQAFQQESYDKLIASFFPETTQNTRQHKKVRKQWSLPRLPKTVPGTLCRCKRQNPNGTVCWQLIATNGASNRGFMSFDGEIDFSSKGVIPLTEIVNSRNLVPIRARFSCRNQSTGGSSESKVIPLDQWRQVALDEQLFGKVRSLAFCPATKDRFRARVSFDLASFAGNVAPLIAECTDAGHWVELNAELKVTSTAEWKAYFGEMLGTPTSKLFIKQLGDIVVLEYRIKTTNTAMKKAYQEGQIISS